MQQKKAEVFSELMNQILNFLERFKYIDRALDSFSKRLLKVEKLDFDEIMKVYNTTGSLYLKSLELLNEIITKFPRELATDELELIESYQKLSEADKFVYRARLKEIAERAK